jgi:hypothetical protein
LPDGSTIVVESGDAASNNTLAELRLVDAATGAETLLANVSPQGLATPRYSADGHTILFSQTDSLGNWQIESIPAGGGSPAHALRERHERVRARLVARRFERGARRLLRGVLGDRHDGRGRVRPRTRAHRSVLDRRRLLDAGGRIAYLSHSFDAGGPHPDLHVPLDPVSALLPAGGSVGSAASTSALVPLATTVTTPVAGTVAIDTSPAVPGPAGYQLLGQEADITAPAATAAAPLVLAFTLDASPLARAGLAAATVDVFRNGVRLPDCEAGATGASPDPCVASRTTLADGSAILTVRTSHASCWTFGTGRFALSSPLAPVDPLPTLNATKAGSSVPVKFGLGADEGLAVLAPGYPKSPRSRATRMPPSTRSSRPRRARAGSSTTRRPASKPTSGRRTRAGAAVASSTCGSSTAAPCAPRSSSAERQGIRRSRRPRAALSSSADRSASRTGTTSDQCGPTGQRWRRHQPKRMDLTDTPGIQIVVNRWPRRQRTVVSVPKPYPRRRATTVATA